MKKIILTLTTITLLSSCQFISHRSEQFRLSHIHKEKFEKVRKLQNIDQIKNVLGEPDKVKITHQNVQTFYWFGGDYIIDITVRNDNIYGHCLYGKRHHYAREKKEFPSE